MNRWRQWLYRLCTLPMRADLWVYDRIAGPMLETEADREEAAKVVPLARPDP
jgi:hypothetical protein